MSSIFMVLPTGSRANPGGPAKVAIFASALFGTISGSSAGNVYTTGVFTIPLMKKCGYQPHFAGAVEAVASTGGMFTPPIMGATAFLVADFLGVSYWTVCARRLSARRAVLRHAAHSGDTRPCVWGKRRAAENLPACATCCVRAGTTSRPLPYWSSAWAC